MKNVTVGLLAGIAVLLVLTGCEEGQVDDKGGGDDDLVFRVNCGADGEFGDRRGNTWKADRAYTKGSWGYEDGETVDRGDSAQIEGTDLPYVFQTERYSMSAYRFTVPNGEYTVGLLFAETFEQLTTKGERVYAVSINGVKVLPKLDLIAEANGSFKAFAKVFDVEVTKGEIRIDFEEDVQNPAINGIVIAAGVGGKQRKLVTQGVSAKSE